MTVYLSALTVFLAVFLFFSGTLEVEAQVTVTIPGLGVISTNITASEGVFCLGDITRFANLYGQSPDECRNKDWVEYRKGYSEGIGIVAFPEVTNTVDKTDCDQKAANSAGTASLDERQTMCFVIDYLATVCHCDETLCITNKVNRGVTNGRRCGGVAQKFCRSASNDISTLCHAAITSTDHVGDEIVATGYDTTKVRHGCNATDCLAHPDYRGSAAGKSIALIGLISLVFAFII